MTAGLLHWLGSWPGAALLLAWWAALAVTFGLGWLRAGNGSWRWQQNRVEHDADSPLWGLVMLACLTGVTWYAYTLAAGPVPGLNCARLGFYRALREVPLAGLLSASALIRMPLWVRHQ